MIDVSNIHVFFAEQANTSRRVGSFLYCYCDENSPVTYRYEI